MTLRAVLDIIFPAIKTNASGNTIGLKNDNCNFPGELRLNYQGGHHKEPGGRNPAVHSPVNGIVTNNPSKSPCGAVIIKDDKGITHKLLHIDKTFVKRGSKVKEGQKIGLTGGRGSKGRYQYDKHVDYQMQNENGDLLNPNHYYDINNKSSRIYSYDKFTIERTLCVSEKPKPYEATIFGGPGFDFFERLTNNNKIDPDDGWNVPVGAKDKDGPGNSQGYAAKQLKDGHAKEKEVFFDAEGILSLKDMNSLIQDITAFAADAPDIGVDSLHSDNAAANTIRISFVAPEWQQMHKI